MILPLQIPNPGMIGSFNRERFIQFNPEDSANWFLRPSQTGKKQLAMYPTMGRRHVRFLNQNRFIFDVEPRDLFRSINYMYFVVGNFIYRIDKFFNRIEITQGLFSSSVGVVNFDYLPTPDTVWVGFTDQIHMYVYNETTGEFFVVEDNNAPAKPTYIAAFGNRFAVADLNSTQFRLTNINLNLSPNIFTNDDGDATFAQEVGFIRQMTVLHNTLFIFTDFTTGVWGNIPSAIADPETNQVPQFPWKKNTTYDFDFGIADPSSLDTDFGMMVWLGQNRNGLIQIMQSDGGKPVSITNQAVNILLERNADIDQESPFLADTSKGFLYQYENSIFYRLSAGIYQNSGILDDNRGAASVEYGFDAKEWHRCIEANGDRCRIEKHVFFNNRHYVTVQDDSAVYEMSGRFYNNELLNAAQPDHQAADAFIRYPFRYERITPIISDENYVEFLTNWLQIDFVFGEGGSIYSDAPFENAVFITDPEGRFLVTEDNLKFMITEDSNYPVLNSDHYNKYFKPHVELYYSDDGGKYFLPADVREFSQIGVYNWRMRWYQLGTSRNRVYKLVCVSASPIVILGAIHEVRRASGGAD